MTILLSIIHVLVCLILILIVLLQSGKGADLAGAFGGGGSQTAFGARGTATFLSKVTTGAAIVFMLSSFTLSLYKTHEGRGTSIMSGTSQPVQKQAAPTTPAAAPVTAAPVQNPPTTPAKQKP